MYPHSLACPSERRATVCIRSWEIYTVLADADVAHGELRNAEPSSGAGHCDTAPADGDAQSDVCCAG